MRDVRELLGRLNPQTVKFDTGRGGTPSLTNQDIAGALGFVPAGLGRELLEACWWQDGAARRGHKLRDAVVGLVTPEYVRQRRRLSNAQLDLALVQQAMSWNGNSTAVQRQEVEQARVRLERVVAGCWPNNTIESLPTLTHAIVAEMAGRDECGDCRGMGHVEVEGTTSLCPKCLGSGTSKMSGHKRASALGVSEPAYRKYWKAPYDWMIERFRDEEALAAAALSRALAREAA